MEKEENLIYFITTNNHKFNEISKMFESEKLNYTLKQLNNKTTEIQADSIKENAFFKLNSVKLSVKGSCFVEDAGFFVDKPLNGFPGVYSSYVFRTIGNQGILRLIDDFTLTKAHFIAVIALFFKPLGKDFFFEGRVNGTISETIRGTSGFGFDPIFIPDETRNKTFAELTTKEKNLISHRGIAWKKMIEFLKSK